MAPTSRSATTCAMVPSAPCQARILPSSVEKMKRAGAPATSKLVLLLPTAPVGAFGTWTMSGPDGGGGNGVPSAAYRVDTSVPLSATHHGLVARAVSPHALTRFGSSTSATPG